MSTDNGSKQPADANSGSFEELVGKEYRELIPERVVAAGGRDPEVGSPDPGGEPWVKFTSENLVGLALSGGGVRSATFNLGVLQALEDWHMLERVDYLSTVSGGGYIGGFWTRWRARQRGRQSAPVEGGRDPGSSAAGAPRAARFPTPESVQGDAAAWWPEPPQIRHLREFGRFLVPRRGLSAEFWQAVVTILSGLVPSLGVALGTVVLLTAAWALAAQWLVVGYGIGTTGHPILQYAVVVGVLASVFVIARSVGPAARERRSGASLVATLLILAGGAVGCWVWATWMDYPGTRIAPSPMVSGLVSSGPPEAGAGAGGFLRRVIELDPRILTGSLLAHAFAGAPDESAQASKTFAFDGRLAWPCLATVGALAALSLARDLMRRFRYRAGSGWDVVWIATFDHAVVTIFIVQVAWLALVGLWEFARWLYLQANADLTGPATGAGGIGAVLAMVFFWLRDWLKENASYTADSWWAKAGAILKPMVPRVLAGGVVLALFLLADIFLVGRMGRIAASGRPWVTDWVWVLVACAGVLVGACLLFHPATIGLHEFYRARVARCYLGAAAEKPSQLWAEQADDDMPLSGDTGRPVHLICCAANQSCGDPMNRLHRGARSAVLSRHGIALGNHHAAADHLRLSAAMTTSAAALNSLMGELNVTLGRAVPFVMTALNMRLGCWVRNPAARASGAVRVLGDLYRKFPGLHYLNELMGQAGCGTAERPSAFIHLSDGGHFENLGLYELVRRHCRYIIVSDAGADADFAFDDLGRAARRVREDFNVEIELDLQPLRPGENGWSEQHLSVGVIHYDGRRGTDKGVIVYLKPALTGNESVDVLQYRKVFAAFPHEPTRDQFFDEAQFESYRRLGQHTVDSILTIEGIGAGHSPEAVFHKLRLYWQKVPWMHTEQSVRLCDHAAELEAVIADAGASAVRREFFGEFVAPDDHHPGGKARRRADDDAGDLWLVLRILKYMEEALVTCELERHWSNPRARSWMSYLQRYAAMPVMRKWWPSLKPLLGADFIRFADVHLFLATASGSREPATCNIVLHPLLPRESAQPETAFTRRMRECGVPLPARERTLFGLFLEWAESCRTRPGRVQVGLAAVTETDATGDRDPTDGRARRVVSWEMNDVFVPPELGGGDEFRTKMIAGIIGHYENEPVGVTRLEVRFGDGKSRDASVGKADRRGKAKRQDLIEHIGMYRSLGFKFDRAVGGGVVRMALDVAGRKPVVVRERDRTDGRPAGSPGPEEVLRWIIHRRGRGAHAPSAGRRR